MTDLLQEPTPGSLPPTKRPFDDVERLAVSPKKACFMLDCSHTYLYELINARELTSFRVGKFRKILVSSIHDYVQRCLARAGTT